MTYDEVGTHLREAGSIDRAAAPLGIYLAWCVNHGLISKELMNLKSPNTVAVKLREITGSQLLVAGCGGILESRWFNNQGNHFCSLYYPRYIPDFKSVFGADIYDVKDDWSSYDLIAPLLTKHLYDRNFDSSRKRWWKLWGR